jgi:hypothetical protein
LALGGGGGHPGPGPHHIRLGYGIPEDELREALDLVREAFDEVTA